MAAKGLEGKGEGVDEGLGVPLAAVALKCCWTATWPHASIDILNCAECKKALHIQRGVCE